MNDSHQHGTSTSRLRHVLFYISILSGLCALIARFCPIDHSQLFLIIDSVGKFGYVNSDGRIAIEPQWPWAQPFDSEGLAAVSNKDHLCGWIDRNGKVVIPIEYSLDYSNDLDSSPNYPRPWEFDSSGMVRVKKRGRMGWLNREGGTVVSADWDEAYPFQLNGLGRVVRDGKSGWINRHGEVVIQPEWEVKEFESRNDWDSAGMALVRKNGKLGWVNNRGNLVIPLVWDDAQPFDAQGMASVCRDSKWGWIDREGEVVIPLKWSNALPFGEGDFAYVWTEIEGRNRCGVINRNGEVVIPPMWDSIGRYSESEKMFSVSIWDPDSFSFRWGWAGIDGRIIEPVWDSAEEFDEFGMAVVSKKELYGWVDHSGKTVIPLKWQNVYAFDSRGLAWVELNDKQGWINRSGEEVIPVKWSSDHRLYWFSRDWLLEADLTLVGEGEAFHPKWGLIDRDCETVVELKWDGFKILRNRGIHFYSQGSKGGTGKAMIYYPLSRRRVNLPNPLSTDFNENGHAWTYLNGDISLHQLVDRQGEVVIDHEKPDQWWLPVKPEQPSHLKGLGRHIWKANFSSGKPEVYTVKRTQEIGGITMFYLQLRNWFEGNDASAIPENEWLCHCYNADGNLIWSSDWVRFELKCWIMFSAAIVIAFYCRPRRQIIKIAEG